jgi:putative inorganic carbon (hco3(-)) transporter
VVAQLLVVISAPLALNVLLLCNSRGAFLGLIGAAFSFLLIAQGATEQARDSDAGPGCLTLYMLLGDAKILDRSRARPS